MSDMHPEITREEMEARKKKTSIDDKLKKIWCEKEGCTLDSVIDQKGLDEIKQAFADKGFHKNKLVPEGDATFVAYPCMTGQEWYEKFRIEFRKLAPKSYAKDFYAKKAARKAAGIKEDMNG